MTFDVQMLLLLPANVIRKICMTGGPSVLQKYSEVRMMQLEGVTADSLFKDKSSARNSFYLLCCFADVRAVLSEQTVNVSEMCTALVSFNNGLADFNTLKIAWWEEYVWILEKIFVLATFGEKPFAWEVRETALLLLEVCEKMGCSRVTDFFDILADKACNMGALLKNFLSV